MNDKIIIVVLQYNNSKLTLDCLESLSYCRDEFYSVAVVDNNSEAEHQLAADYYCKNNNNWCFFIQNSKNGGYSNGNNIGIRYALGRGASHVLILNNDVVLERGDITALRKQCNSLENIGLAGPAIGEHGTVFYGGIIRWLAAELHHNLEKPPSGILPTDIYLPGMALLIRREVFEKSGLLDERFFLYFEDVEFCQRARESGFMLAIESAVVVTHRGSASTSAIPHTTLLRYHYRNALLFNSLHAPRRVKMLLPFWAVKVYVKQLLKTIFIPRRGAAGAAIIEGIRDYYNKRWGMAENAL